MFWYCGYWWYGKNREAETIAAFRMLVRGGDPEVMEGQAQGQRIVILEFPDKAAAKRFYNSAEYQEILKIRQPVSVAHGILVDGVAPGAWEAAVTESNKHG